MKDTFFRNVGPHMTYMTRNSSIDILFKHKSKEPGVMIAAIGRTVFSSERVSQNDKTQLDLRRDSTTRLVSLSIVGRNVVLPLTLSTPIQSLQLDIRYEVKDSWNLARRGLVGAAEEQGVCELTADLQDLAGVVLRREVGRLVMVLQLCVIMTGMLSINLLTYINLASY
jgi:hypothetical protein